MTNDFPQFMFIREVLDEINDNEQKGGEQSNGRN